MNLVNVVALVVLTLVGYSAGAVLGGRLRHGRNIKVANPTLLDTLAVAGLWIGAVVARGSFAGSWRVVGIWFIVGSVVGLAVNLIQRQRDQGKPISQ